MNPLDDVRSDLEAAADERDYAAVNTLWLALLKLANLEDGQSELARMGALMGRIPEAKVRVIVGDAAVDALLNLDPPLETVVSHPREKLKTEQVSAALDKIRMHRASSPREALAEMGFVLKTIRNKREHAFKTRDGLRDTEILRPARRLLNQLGQAALESRVLA